MLTVRVVEAKAKFSSLLSAVETGETVSITRHGRVVARLVHGWKNKRGMDHGPKTVGTIGVSHRLGGLTVDHGKDIIRPVYEVCERDLRTLFRRHAVPSTVA